MRDHGYDRLKDWKTAGEECLTAALDRARVLATDAADFKSLESLIKTVGDIVGTGNYLNRRSGGGAAAATGGDYDDE